MFDIAPSEFLLVAIVALVVIGPKDLPKAMRVLGYWVGRARGVARQFRSGFDSMVQEAELADMEKKWAAENERIMSEHKTGEVAETAIATSPPPATATAEAAPAVLSDDVAAADDDLFSHPVMVEKPHVEPALVATPSPREDEAMS